MTIYDHIQELRAELKNAPFEERPEILADLAAAEAEQAKLDEAFDADLRAFWPLE
jgi:hypothetical protein